MKYALLFLMAGVINTTQCQQKFDTNNSFLISTFKGKDYISDGTGFVAKYKGRFFLITNYHVLANKEASDTTMYKSPTKLIPNRIKIRIPSKDRKTFSTKEIVIARNSARLFKTYKTSINTYFNTHSVYDVAILPLNENISPFTIPLEISSIDLSIVVNSEKIYLYGFAGESSKTRFTPDEIILSSLDNQPYGITDNIITKPASKQLNGASGSPSYIVRNKIKEFVGMQSGVNQKTNKGMIIGSGYIISLLNDFFKN